MSIHSINYDSVYTNILLKKGEIEKQNKKKKKQGKEDGLIWFCWFLNSKLQKILSFIMLIVHREIVPPRETVAIARVAIAIVGRGGWGSLPYTVANENQMKA